MLTSSQVSGENSSNGVTPERSRCQILCDKISTYSRKPLNALEFESPADVKVFCFIYLYFLVSAGLVLAVVGYAKKGEFVRRSNDKFDIFCICCMALSIAWILYNFLRRQRSKYIKFAKYPKRYYRPFLVVAYFFGTVSVVVDTLTIIVTALCAKSHPVRWTFTLTKVCFTFLAILYLTKFSTAVYRDLCHVRFALFHVIGTYVCLLVRTPLTDSRPSFPKTPWFGVRHCIKVLKNPSQNENDAYFHSFDTEFGFTACVVLMILWTNTRSLPDPEKPAHALSDSFEQIELEFETIAEQAHVQSREPHVDIGLILGLTFGAILSFPYTFYWQSTILNDKQIELYVYHLGFILLMLMSSMLALCKTGSRDMTYVRGLNFPCALMLFFLMFPCAWYTMFSIIAPTAEVLNHRGNNVGALMLVDEIATFIESTVQTFLIIKVYTQCPRHARSHAGNIIRQCALFLMVGNFVQWLHMVWFDINHRDENEVQNRFFGSQLWHTISSTVYPFCMFYRLFSSVCLYEISAVF